MTPFSPISFPCLCSPLQLPVNFRQNCLNKMFLLLVLASVALSRADYQKFFFSANGTCPGLAWPCVQNSVAAVCAYDSITDKHYCCGGAAQGTCRISSPDCLGADGGHSSTQQRCTADDSNWCCLKDTESCTCRIGKRHLLQLCKKIQHAFERANQRMHCNTTGHN
jgi:hypothetical protein